MRGRIHFTHLAAACLWNGCAHARLSDRPATLMLLEEAVNTLVHDLAKVAEGRCAVLVMRAPKGAAS